THINYLKLSVNNLEQTSMTFPKLLELHFFSSTFPGLEITILKFHDFSRFFFRTLTPVSTNPDSRYWDPRIRCVCVCVCLCVCVCVCVFCYVYARVCGVHHSSQMR